MRISYDRDADTAYIQLGHPTASAHRATTRALMPAGIDGFIALDWQDGQLIGIEILDASARLSHEILEQAEPAD